MPQLTSKELAALEDQLNCEQILIKKYKNYAQMTQDENLRNCCENLAAKHKSHYDTLMGHLSC